MGPDADGAPTHPAQGLWAVAETHRNRWSTFNGAFCCDAHTCARLMALSAPPDTQDTGTHRGRISQPPQGASGTGPRWSRRCVNTAWCCTLGVEKLLDDFRNDPVTEQPY